VSTVILTLLVVVQARPLLEERGTLPFDPRLENRVSEIELNSMLHAASCCIRRDPSVRPRMAQVGNCLYYNSHVFLMLQMSASISLLSFETRNSIHGAIYFLLSYADCLYFVDSF
jgi:hypothetical protein